MVNSPEQASLFPDAMPDGFSLVPGYLDESGQRRLLEAVRTVVAAAPLYVPRMPVSGRPFSVRMTNCGPLGWVSDEGGYRYQPTHPETGEPWPPLPELVLDAWHGLSRYPHPPEACLVNYYAPGTRLGLHQDKDEADFSAPVLSLSLGDEAVFRIGGTKRKDPTRSVRLKSGDAVLLGANARLAYHGVERIIGETSSLLDEGGRFNLTLRRVTKPTYAE